MSEENDEIVEFQFDDRFWWLRWVDHYEPVHETGSSASVGVNFCLLPEGLSGPKRLDTAEVLRHSGEIRQVRVSAGYLPRLRLGTVFHKGREQGQLPLVLKTFKFNLRDWPAHIFTAWQDRQQELQPDPAPYPAFPVLGRQEFRLEDDIRGWAMKKEVHCIVLEDEEKSLVIPCHEVCRALFAPHREFALALTNGPWDLELNRIVNPERTGMLDPQTWHVVLRKGVPDNFAYYAANLVINPAGRRAARLIHDCVMSEKGTLQATFPFELDSVHFAVRCLQVRETPAKYLGLEIASFEWPAPNITIYWSRDNDSTIGIIEEPTDDLPPYQGVKRPGRPAVGSPIAVDSSDDPNSKSGKLNLPTRGLVWWNPPPLHHIEKGKSKQYLRIPQREDTDPPSMPPLIGSPTRGSRTRKKKPTINYQSTERLISSRFLKLVDTLDQLKTSGVIEHWEVVEPPVEGVPLHDFVLWRFPPTVLDDKENVKKLRWSYISKRELLLRTALVLKVSLEGQEIYWVETELRSEAGGYCLEIGFRSLLFRIGTMRIEAAVTRALVICAIHKGIWPKKGIVQKELGAEQVYLWVHQYEQSESTEGDCFPNNSQKWNKDSVLKALRKLLDRPAAPAEPVPEMSNRSFSNVAIA